MILDTNADLNIYKEMGKREKANGPDSTGSCCDQVNHSTSGLINNLPDMDFNIWTGELTYKGTQYRSTTNNSLHGSLSKGSFKIFAIKPDTQD